MVMKYKMGIIHWVRENYKSICLSGLVVFLLAVAPARAVVRVHLDQETVAKGYTVSLPNERFALGIPAGLLTEETLVTLKRPAKADRAGLNSLLEPEWERVGKLRTYNLSMTEPHVLDQSVWVTLHIPANPTRDYVVAFFDRESYTWKEIPSSVNWFGQQITAALPFPYATVGVFSVPHVGPIPKTDFQSLEATLGNLSAASVMVMDQETGEILYAKEANTVRSIASMTKVATTWLALTYVEDWDQTVTYDDSWSREGAALRVVDGETLTVEDVLYTTLIGSANNTAVALANIFTDQATFVGEMNTLADNLGLDSTQFVEPSGLDAGNVSTAYEYALLSKAAFENFDLLKLATTKAYSFNSSATGTHNIKTTNALLYSDLYLTGGKTGYTEEAGYCLMIQAKNDTGHQVIVVVMGEPTSSSRFTETYALTQWAFENYTWN